MPGHVRVTPTTCKRALDLLRGAGINGLGDANPVTWADVLNAAPLTTTGDGGRRTPVTRPDGTPVMLRPADGEVMPAAMRIATLGGRFVQAADLAAAVQEVRQGDRSARAARIRADADARGPLLPVGLGGDAGTELAWRRAATAAVGAGATRQRAEAHAWAVVGRTPPRALPPGEDVLDGLSGPARAREVLARLRAGGGPHPGVLAGASGGLVRAG